MKYLNKIDTFFVKLEEAFNQPLEIRWIKKDDWIGIFHTKKHEYRIIIKNYGDNIWRYKFYLYENSKLSVELTKFDYDKIKVLSTINKSFIDFIDEISPNSIIFGANNDSDFRIKLYSNFCHQVKDKYGYELMERSKGDSKEVNPTLFILFKSNINKSKLVNIVQDIINDELGNL